MSEEKKTGIEIVEVPTEFGLAFKNNNNEEVLDMNQLLVKIANDIEDLKKAIIQ